jgi:hypothetical protein
MGRGCQGRRGGRPAPRRNDLPANLFDFTGREAESTRAEELLHTAGRSRSTAWRA